MLLYFRMYQIAKAYPGMTKFANADEYLMLAYRTSVAYWTVPMQTDKPWGWSANSVPTMNEAFLPELIAALEREGKRDEAAKLHELWNSKVIEFVNEETRRPTCLVPSSPLIQPVSNRPQRWPTMPSSARPIPRWPTASRQVTPPLKLASFWSSS